MTNNEEQRPVRKLGAAGWVVLLFLLGAAGSIIVTVLYLVWQYANTLGGQ